MTERTKITNKEKHFATNVVVGMGAVEAYKNAYKEPLTYFERLMGDIVNKTSTAMEQSHCLKVMELAITAQNSAKRIGYLKQ